MVITASELKTNLGKYLAMAAEQDIFITKNGKNIAKLSSPTVDQLAVLDGLVGILPAGASADIREERILGQ